MKKSWFTLIETIIAILIFSIWILTILVVISKNVLTADRIKNKTTATFLAKEWIEIIYNQRDTNLDKWLAWNCTKTNSNYECIDKFWVGKYYKTWVNLSGWINITTSNSSNQDNLLYFHEWKIKDSVWAPILSGFWYDYNTDWKKTIFSRFVWFSWLYLESESGIADTTKILKINSYVRYNKGSAQDEVVLESIIWEK